LERQRIAAQRDAKQQWVDFDNINWNMPLAAIAAEDQRFPNHWGFDTKQIQLALQSNRKGGSQRGASTISQQTIKNLFLWPKRSYLRKAVEAWLTLMSHVFFGWPVMSTLIAAAPSSVACFLTECDESSSPPELNFN